MGEKLNAFKAKAKDILEKHGGKIVAGGLAVGAAITAVVLHRKSGDVAVTSGGIELERTDDPFTSGWREDLYGEDYDKVVEFAKSLHLKEGEQFIIDDSLQYRDIDWYTGPRDGTPIVSHLVNGNGVYRPEPEEN